MPGKRANAETDEQRGLLPNYVRQWRRHRKLTLQQLAERSKLSITTVSEIERHVTDFTGKTLGDIARALETNPASLLHGPPAEGDEIWAIWEDLGRQNRRREVVAVLRALRDIHKG